MCQWKRICVMWSMGVLVEFINTRHKTAHVYAYAPSHASYLQQQRQRLAEAQRELDAVLLHLAQPRDAAAALVDVPSVVLWKEAG